MTPRSAFVRCLSSSSFGVVEATPSRGTSTFASQTMAFNTSYNHCVWNRSNENRYHMIVHGGEASEYWNNVVPNSYTSYIDSSPQ